MFARAPRSAVLAAALSLVFFGAPEASAQGLDVPVNPLCTPCERAMGTYWEAWPALDTKLAALDKQEKELKPLLDAAADSRRKHITGGDKARPGLSKGAGRTRRRFQTDRGQTRCAV